MARPPAMIDDLAGQVRGCDALSFNWLLNDKRDVRR